MDRMRPKQNDRDARIIRYDKVQRVMSIHTVPNLSTLEAIRGPNDQDRRFFGHPRGLATLFFTEMWERFSYYGMRALLILFMVAGVDKGGLGFGVAKSGAIYGLYTAMVYLFGLPGGWIAERSLGQRRGVPYGVSGLAFRHVRMALS